MTIEITILISVISVSAAIFFGMKNLKKADTDSVKEDAKKNAEIIFKLDESISMLRSMQEDMKEMASRMARTEKDTEMLAMRFATLEKRVDRLENNE